MFFFSIHPCRRTLTVTDCCPFLSSRQPWLCYAINNKREHVWNPRKGHVRPTISSTNAACYYIRFCLTYETNKIESVVCSIAYVSSLLASWIFLSKFNSVPNKSTNIVANRRIHFFCIKRILNISNLALNIFYSAKIQVIYYYAAAKKFKKSTSQEKNRQCFNRGIYYGFVCILITFGDVDIRIDIRIYLYICSSNMCYNL